MHHFEGSFKNSSRWPCPDPHSDITHLVLAQPIQPSRPSFYSAHPTISSIILLSPSNHLVHHFTQPIQPSRPSFYSAHPTTSLIPAIHSCNKDCNKTLFWMRLANYFQYTANESFFSHFFMSFLIYLTFISCIKEN